ncbi:sulfatase family protein [Clostridium perfringens]
MENIIFLLTKDCMSCESLPIYENKYWNTPNIDELANKGTIFYRHYTAGASTSMSLTAMLSGHYPFEFNSRKRYTKVVPSEYPSIYDYFQKSGYETHLIWDTTWQDETWDLVREFGDESKVIVHSIDIAQPVGSHKKSQKGVERNEELLDKTYKLIYDSLNSIDLGKKQFIWMHLPHVLKGRRAYMDDMDVFDNIVGYVRNLVGDDSIYISSDHGHMNMHKNKVGYGFDVYEPIIKIPLITPRIDEKREVHSITSNIDIFDILTNHKIPKHEYVVSDTTYYAQINRKLSIITERYKYIYNKESNTEELYDLDWDPLENYNILKKSYFDKDRQSEVFYDELYFYPFKDEALNELLKLRKIKNELWRDSSNIYNKYIRFRRFGNKMKKKLSSLFF